MILYHIVILALIQGITEFLPISSSGHLILVHAVLDESAGALAAEDLMMDIAVHIGTLLSVLLYFRRDVLVMLGGVKDWATGRRNTEGAKLDLYIIISSIPVMIAGFTIHAIDPYFVRSVQIMAWMTLVFGIVLWHADKYRPAARDLKDLTIKDALLIGLAQCLALIPGVSRSGITMTAARYLGFSRANAARYSLFLAILAISGAGTLGAADLIENGDAALGADVFAAAFLSFIAGLAAISLMMKWLERASFTPFAIYRVALGIVLLGLIYTGAI